MGGHGQAPLDSQLWVLLRHPLVGCWWHWADPSSLMLAGGLCLQGTSWTALRTPLHPSRPAHTLCPQVGQQCMLGGGHTSPWGRGALSPLLAPSMGTGPTGTGGHRHVGRIPPSGGCASLEMVDGHPAHCPVPGLAAGWFPAPSLGLSLLDAHSSILPAPQMRPSAAQPPGWSPAPSPGQPGEPWEGSCLLSLQPAARTSPGAPSP